MDTEKISRFENLLGRALRPEEKERLERIQNCLGIRSSDALWDIITALEYQRTYYEDMPAKIRESTADILKDLSSAAEKKVTAAHSRLAEHVVQQAQDLSLKIHVRDWMIWGSFALFLHLVYGSLLLWAGYGIAAGLTRIPPVLQMPVGVVLAVLSLSTGLFLGVLAAKNFAQENTIWRKFALASVVCIAPSGVLAAYALI